MKAIDRFNDLNRQGFMRAVYQRPRKTKTPVPIVTCEACQDWHRKGKHTKDRVARKGKP